MFYVSGPKIYLATFDAELKVFPEVKLTWIGYDQLGVVKTGGGVAQKPKVYKLCTLPELIAQFGGTVAPVTEQPKTDGDGDKDQKDDSANK